MLTLGPAFHHTESSGKQTLVAIHSLVQVLVPLKHGVIKLLLEKDSKAIALQGKREAMTVKDSWVKWFVSNFLLLTFCWAKGWIWKSYHYKNQSSVQKELPFILELATTAGFQVLQYKKLTSHYVKNLNCFLIFLSCKILPSFIFFKVYFLFNF